jgi:hypothetical protein
MVQADLVGLPQARRRHDLTMHLHEAWCIFFAPGFAIAVSVPLFSFSAF